MGIPHLFKWLRNKNYREVLKRSVPTYVSSFSFDFNSVLHTVAQTVYAYGEGADPKRQKLIAQADPLQLEAEYYQALATKLSEIISQVRPQEVLVLAVDGVAPQAKIAQQRQRRYRSAMESSGTSVFNNSALTPGTEFMKRLDNFIQRWLIASSKTLPPKVIYSSHMVPGEGEHQILSLMRKGEISGKGAHVVYGMDADLIMLSLLAPLNNIHLMREDISSVIDINNLKLALKEELLLSTSVEDFVVMIFLLGNDFLPHLVSLADLDESIETMMRIYKMTGVNLTKEKDIDWANMSKYLVALSLEEPRLLELESMRDVKYPSRMMQRATIKTSSIGMGKNDVTVKNMNKFDLSIFRGAWYENVFQLKAKNTVFQKLLPQMNFGATNNKIVEMVKSYLTGISWVFRYYSLGMEFVNNDYVYRYHYAPLLSDIAAVSSQFSPPLNSYDYNSEALEINPVHQLLAVLPLKSKNLLPQEVLHLTNSDSIIADYFPQSQIIERDGMNTDWQGVVLINFVDMNRIINAVNKTTIFSQQRINEFSPVNNIILQKDPALEELDEKARKFRQYTSQESSKGRGNYKRSYDSLRGRVYQKQEGVYQKQEAYQKQEGGYQKQEGGYQKQEGGRGRGRGRGYQKQEGGYQKGGRGRGNYQKQEGGYQGSPQREFIPQTKISPFKPSFQPVIQPSQVPQESSKTIKPLPVKLFEL